MKNESDYKSSGVSVAGGSGSSMVSVAAGTALSMLGNSSGNSSSTTKSDIAAGTVDVRNGDQTALAGLDRTASELQQSGLKDIFDQKKLAEQKELAAVAGEVGFRVAGDVASVMQRKAQADVLNAPDEETRKEAQSRLEAWSDGGTNKVLLHGLTGAAIAALGGESALQGMAAAAGAEAAKGAMSDYLVAHGITDKETYNALMELGSAAIGGLLGGQAGATTALSGDQFNRQLHPDEVTWIRQNAPSFALQEGISEEEATRRLTVEAAAQVDAIINERVGAKVDESALSFLNTNKNQYAWGSAFRATEAEYNNFNLYGKELASSPDNFLAVYNSLYQSGVRKDTLQSDYNAELLTFAGTQIGSSGRGVLAVPATGLVLGGGAAVGVVATPMVITACLSNPVACNGVGIGAIDIVAGEAMGGHGLSGAAGAAEKKAAKVIQDAAEKAALKKGAAKGADTSLEPTLTSSVDVPSGNGISGYPDLPAGYGTLKSGGAAANETGGLPDGFRRVLNSEGEVVIQGKNGSIYKEVDIASGQKGAWSKDLNKPEPNTIYNVDGNKTYRTNASGDVEYVEASISLNVKGRNGYQQCKAGNCGFEDDEGGHLIASIFDGPGEKLNLVPMNANLNKGAWKAMENSWSSALKEGKSVKVKIEPIYSGQGRPDKFNVTYQLGSDPPVYEIFKNSPGGL
ncbi:DNA/RNA non-specific endonuclease [Xanthomonas translucens pv. undulosa]